MRIAWRASRVTIRTGSAWRTPGRVVSYLPSCASIQIQLSLSVIWRDCSGGVPSDLNILTSAVVRDYLFFGFSLEFRESVNFHPVGNSGCCKQPVRVPSDFDSMWSSFSSLFVSWCFDGMNCQLFGDCFSCLIFKKTGASRNFQIFPACNVIMFPSAFNIDCIIPHFFWTAGAEGKKSQDCLFCFFYSSTMF